MSDIRADLRRQWRSDCKNMSVDLKWRNWTPTSFDGPKAAIRKAKAEAQTKIERIIAKSRGES